MIAGIAAIAVAALFIKKGKWDKATLVLIVLGAGVLAKTWDNPLSDIGGDVVKLLAVVALVALVVDLATRRIEKVTYGVGFALPFLALACDGLIGQLADTIFSANPLASIFNALV